MENSNKKEKTTHTQLKEKFNILSSWMLVSPSMFSPCAPLDLLYGSPVLTTCTLSKAQPAIWISLWGRGWAKYGRRLFVLHVLPKTAQHVTLEHSNDSLTGKEIYGSQLKKTSTRILLIWCNIFKLGCSKLWLKTTVWFLKRFHRTNLSSSVMMNQSKGPV